MATGKTRTPLISVIAVSYNHERYVLETLESIKAQTCQDFELIYADDASQDRSAQIATEWLRGQSFPTRTIIHRENRGLCRTLNKALRLCRGKYVQLIACDDVLLPEKFEKQATLMEGLSEDTAVVYSDAYLMDENSNLLPGTHCSFIEECRFGFPEGRVFDQLLVCDFVPAVTALIRRSVYDNVGTYDESLFFEDWDMWLRIAERYLFAFSPFISATYRRTSGSMSAARGGWKNVVFSQTQMLMKWLRSGRLSSKNREVAIQKLGERARKLYAWGDPRSAEVLRAAKSMCPDTYFRIASLGATLGLSHRFVRRVFRLGHKIKRAAAWLCRLEPFD